MNKPLLTTLAGAAVLVLVTACRSSQPPKFVDLDMGSPVSATSREATSQTVTLTNDLDPVWLRAPTNQFTLGPGDRLEVELLDDPASKTLTVVGPDGKLYFNLLPGLDVWGLTLGQAKALMEQNLTQYIRGAPRVNMTLREVGSKSIWLLGRLQAPGIYPMQHPMTLLEGISMAGGSLTFTGTKEVTGGPLGEDLADLQHSFIVRNGRLVAVDFDRLLNHGDLSQNIYLLPDDFVYFAPALTREVYVLGAVTQPKPVPFSHGLTVAGAIAGAFGTIRDAYLNHVVVIRGSLAQPQVTVLNYKAIVHGDAADMALQPHDIVYVPFAPYRYIRKYVDVALNAFTSSMAINAGSRAITGGGGPPAGIVIPAGSAIQVIPQTPPPIH